MDSEPTFPCSRRMSNRDRPVCPGSGALRAVSTPALRPRIVPLSLAATSGLSNAPGVDEVAGRREVLAARQEEGALLGVVERLAWIEGQLLGVGFHLGEVGIDRRVQVEVRGDAVAKVEAEGRRGRVVVPARGPRGALRAGRGDRVDVHGRAATQVAEAPERALLGQEGRLALVHGRPRELTAGVGNAADNVEPPHLVVGRGEAQAGEGDPHLHLVAALREPALRLVYEVGREVGRIDGAVGREQAGCLPLTFDAHAVLLHPEGVDAEREGAARVVVGVEQDPDAVVVADLVAGRHAGAHGTVDLERPDAHVQRVGRVPQTDLRRVLGGEAVLRQVARETREESGPAPGGLVQRAVDPHGGVQPRDLHVGLAAVATEHEGGRVGLNGPGRAGARRTCAEGGPGGRQGA